MFRWKKLLANCCDHGILPTRVAAIDARRGHQSMIYGAESSSENTSSTTNIPPEVVALKWDSTTNAKFDIKCRVNTSTPLTPSERACAASHVITWKLIYDIFAKKSMTPPSQLTSYISSSVNTVGRIQNGGEQFKRNGFTPLPSRRVYDSIPDLWISSPRPEYQRHIFTAEERQAQIDSVSDFLAIRNQSSVEHYGNFFLILEDDAVVDPHPKVKGKYSHPQCKKLVKKNFLQRLKEIEDKIPADFDICYLGYNGKSYKKLVKKILVRPQYVWQLHAYLLSPKGAAKLLTQLPVSAPVDNFIAKLIYEKQLEVTSVRFVHVWLVTVTFEINMYAFILYDRLMLYLLMLSWSSKQAHLSPAKQALTSHIHQA
jgi:GR25 family glycosyltransferase involved in LPS biosynthesis